MTPSAVVTVAPPIATNVRSIEATLARAEREEERKRGRLSVPMGATASASGGTRAASDAATPSARGDARSRVCGIELPVGESEAAAAAQLPPLCHMHVADESPVGPSRHRFDSAFALTCHAGYRRRPGSGAETLPGCFPSSRCHCPWQLPRLRSRSRFLACCSLWARWSPVLRGGAFCR